MLHDIRMTHFDIKPANMVYDKNSDMLKIIDMGSAFGDLRKDVTSSTSTFNRKLRSTTPEYSPPEILRKVENLDRVQGLKIDMSAVDVYCWAMCFYSMLLNMKVDELVSDNERYKIKLEADYKKYIENVNDNLELLDAEDSVEDSIKKFVKKILVNALEYKPTERPTMRAIVCEMKNFEINEGVKVKYTEIEADYNKKLMAKLMIINDKEEEEFTEPTCTECDSCFSAVNEKVELYCGDMICKNCLVQNVLKSLLKKKPYKYLYFCYLCETMQRLKVLKLDCGCLWTKFGEKVINKALINKRPIKI
jgi:serine/threonine protein kinase